MLVCRNIMVVATYPLFNSKAIMLRRFLPLARIQTVFGHKVPAMFEPVFFLFKQSPFFAIILVLLFPNNACCRQNECRWHWTTGDECTGEMRHSNQCVLSSAIIISGPLGYCGPPTAFGGHALLVRPPPGLFPTYLAS
jgi:hypothetical protein